MSTRFGRAFAALAATTGVLCAVAPVASGQSALPDPGSAGGAVGSIADWIAQTPRPAPDGGARLVVLGDSQTAGTNLPFLPDKRQCLQSDTRWPQVVARDLGVAGTPDMQDYSCWGGSIDTAPGWQLSDQARSAADKGSFGPRTELVTIQAGMNDIWGTPGVRYQTALQGCWFDLVAGCDLDAIPRGRAQDPSTITAEAFVARIRPVVDYLRYYAPRARILVVGYPDMRGPGGSACLSVLGFPVHQPRAAAFHAFFDSLDVAQRDGARLLGLGFVDARSATAGHGPCTAEPWVDGLVDVRSDSSGGPLHLSPRGEFVTGQAVLAELRR